MCGIFGYTGKSEHASQIVLDGLRSLEYRGYDSWGIACVPADRGNNNNKLIIKKKAGKISEAKIEEFPKNRLSFGHTRWATHGGVTDINAHPHLDCTGKIAIIHNGIIENYLSLKNMLLKKGHRFISETDTEVAVHLIEEYAKTTLLSKAVQKAFNQIEGLNAFLILSEADRKIIVVRNGSPLVVGYGSNGNYVASDAMALIPYTKQVHFLEDNQMAIISQSDIMLFNAKTGEEIKPIKQKLTWSFEQTIKGKYDYFMLKEINEQPAILADIVANYSDQAQKLARVVKSAYGTYMVGCGTAGYACLAASYLFSQIAHRHVNWAVSSEFNYLAEFLTPKSLVIALSQSGETMDTIEAINKAKQRGAQTFSIVNAVGSTIQRISDHVMLIGAGPEKGVASTKAFTAKLAHLILLSFAISGNITKAQKMITQAAKASLEILNGRMAGNISHVARKIVKSNNIFVIGRGLSYPIALEAALKIKEISYIHAEGLAGGELKHGPLALINKGVPCIAFIPHDETYEDTLSGIMELKARGAMIIGVSDKPNPIFDYFIKVRDCSYATAIPMVIFAQLLAYDLAILKGYDPDKPRNLAKSVTVK